MALVEMKENTAKKLAKCDVSHLHFLGLIGSRLEPRQFDILMDKMASEHGIVIDEEPARPNR